MASKLDRIFDRKGVIKKERKVSLMILNENDYASSFFYEFNAVVVGEPKSGKSSLVNGGVKGEYVEDSMTMGLDLFQFKLVLDGKNTKMNIYDCAGNQSFKPIYDSNVTKSELAFIVFSIDNEESFKKVPEWLDYVKGKNPNIKAILVGTKCDLEQERKISKEQAEKLKEEKGMGLYFETSAKTGDNAKELFIDACMYLAGY